MAWDWVVYRVSPIYLWICCCVSRSVLSGFAGFDFGRGYPDNRFVNNKTHKMQQSKWQIESEVRQHSHSEVRLHSQTKNNYFMFWHERQWQSSKLLSWRKLNQSPIDVLNLFLPLLWSLVRPTVIYNSPTAILTISCFINRLRGLLSLCLSWVLFSPPYNSIYIDRDIDIDRYIDRSI